MLPAVLGDLVQTTAGTRPRSRCPNGHPLGENQVLVGHVACLGHGGGGHTSWHCRTCDAVVYGPPMNTHCTCLDGPARVPISTGWRADCLLMCLTGAGPAPYALST